VFCYTPTSKSVISVCKWVWLISDLLLKAVIIVVEKLGSDPSAWLISPNVLSKAGAELIRFEIEVSTYCLVEASYYNTGSNKLFIYWLLISIGFWTTTLSNAKLAISLLLWLTLTVYRLLPEVLIFNVYEASIS
jgi:hypothetical protein